MNVFRRMCFIRLISYTRSSILPVSKRPHIVHNHCLSTVHTRCLSRTPIFKNGEYERLKPKSEEEVVNVIYIDRGKNSIPIKGKVGDNILYLAHLHQIDLEGACEASLSCSTCHVYIEDDYLDTLPEASDEENDMLDLAIFQMESSRLGCQIFLTKEMEGMKISLPCATRNFYVDGHVPKPH